MDRREIESESGVGWCTEWGTCEQNIYDSRVEEEWGQMFG